MKKLNFILAILTLSGLILTGFTFEKSENYSLSFTANSPLDLSGLIIKTEETEVKKDAGNPESSDWYSEAVSNIQKAEYNVSFSDKLNSFQSPNRANNMRFVYQKNGFTAMLRNNKIALFDESDKTIEEENKKYKYLDEWKINFKLENVSKELNSTIENKYTDFGRNEFISSNNQISIENENLRIQYSNDEKGMRQDFIVKNKPEGNNQLKLKMKTETDLNMVVGADVLMFTDKKGVQKMKYSSLKCWDANGVELRAYFEKPPCRFATSPLSQRGDRENYITSPLSQRGDRENYVTSRLSQRGDRENYVTSRLSQRGDRGGLGNNELRIKF